MAVRAKFIVSKVAKMRGYSNDPAARKIGFEVTLNPVTSGTPEDKAFWEATPSGEIRMSVLNPAAGEQFEPGQAFYVDFTPAD